MDGTSGIGMLLPFLGKTDDERRVMLNSVGPNWEGNQTWFITAGGVDVRRMAARLCDGVLGVLHRDDAGAVRAVLASGRLRLSQQGRRPALAQGVGLGHLHRGFVPALVFGVAFGNLLHGVPFHFDGDLRSFYTGTFWQLLNPFALVAGLMSVAMLTMHGGIYLQMRTEGEVEARARRAARVAGIVFLALFAAAGFWIATGIDGFRIARCRRQIPPSLPSPKPSSAARGLARQLHQVSVDDGRAARGFRRLALALIASARRWPGFALVLSSAAVAGVMLTAGFAMFPFIMPSSSDPKSSLTAWDAVSSYRTLQVMFWAVVIFMPLIIVYTSWVYRVMRGKVTTEHVRENSHSLY